MGRRARTARIVRPPERAHTTHRSQCAFRAPCTAYATALRACGRYYPAKIKALDGVFVEELAAGAVHTIARTSRGEIFTFGAGTGGQLGHGDLREQLLPKLVVGAEL